jgi:hypothetical protein
VLKSSRRAALILSGSALVLAGSVLPAQAAASGWRVSATFTVRKGVSFQTGVDAVSAKDAWEVGFSGKDSGNSAPQFNLRHWTGKAWRTVTLPARTAKAWAKDAAFLTQVGASSARNVWVVDAVSGAYLRLNGTRWSTGRLPGGGPSSESFLVITAVKVFSASNVWAFGESDSISSDDAAPYAAHYNGKRWSTVSVPAPASGSGVIAAVAAVSSASIWAVEQTQPSGGVTPGLEPLPVVLHWTPATGWQDAAQQPALVAGDNLSSVAAEPDGDIWIGGSATNRKKGTSPLAAEWNGTAWSAPRLLGAASSADWEIGSMAPDGSGGLWAVATADSADIAGAAATARSVTAAGRIATARSAAASSSEPQHLYHLQHATWSRVLPGFGKRQWLLEALALVPRSHSVWAVGALQAGSAADGLIAIDGPTPR